MASSHTPLLASSRGRSVDSRSSAGDDSATTPILGGLATRSAARPFATSFAPTALTRGLALVLAVPTFGLFVAHGPRYAGAAVFVAFALARQAVVLGAHFGSQLIVIRVEVVHHRLKGVSARAQELWIKRIAALAVDGLILLGLLVTLSVVAHEVADYNRANPLPAAATPAVILGFITFGLLLLSVLDFGKPSLVTLAVAVEKPGAGLLRLTTSVLHGEPDDAEEHTAETRDARRTRNGNP